MLDQLEESVRRFILDVCAVMYNYGYSEVSIGAIMRLMGIDENTASQHDQELLQLDENFTQALKNFRPDSKLSFETLNELPPAGTTFH